MRGEYDATWEYRWIWRCAVVAKRKWAGFRVESVHLFLGNVIMDQFPKSHTKTCNKYGKVGIHKTLKYLLTDWPPDHPVQVMS